MQEPCSQVVGAEIADNNDYMATTIKNTILFFTDQEIIYSWLTIAILTILAN